MLRRYVKAPGRSAVQAFLLGADELPTLRGLVGRPERANDLRRAKAST